ncbi:hypothetical protein V3I01_08620 [Sphingomonas sp. gentR]|jgi:hypothetical protein|uniref:hypothetical protein n=1 Tax=Sphingomonas sp. gentR TaxID=3118768 RepID=UPI000972D0D5|nr:hypothetical protein AV944_11535 [Sphingomonas sp. LK11]
MRISDPRWLVGALALAGCSGGQEERQAAAQNGPAAEQKPGLAIECALAGAQAFASDCTVEQSGAGNAVVLTVRHPDGGFRRLQVTRDGRGVEAADGAQPASVTVAGDRTIEIAVGGDRYRLPATVGTR